MKKILFSILILLGLMFSSCNKYAEGPMLSLHTKTHRVVNYWKVAQALDNGTDVTPDYNKFELDLYKGGKASLSAEYTFFGDKLKFTTEGTWTFVSNKEKLSLNFDNDDADGVYTILRLKENEMWLKKDGGTIELHFVPR